MHFYMCHTIWAALVHEKVDKVDSRFRRTVLKLELANLAERECYLSLQKDTEFARSLLIVLEHQLSGQVYKGLVKLHVILQSVDPIGQTSGHRFMIILAPTSQLQIKYCRVLVNSPAYLGVICATTVENAR